MAPVNDLYAVLIRDRHLDPVIRIIQGRERAEVAAEEEASDLRCVRLGPEEVTLEDPILAWWGHANEEDDVILYRVAVES